MGLIDATTATTSESNGDDNDMCRHVTTKNDGRAGRDDDRTARGDNDRTAGGDGDGKMGPDDS